MIVYNITISIDNDVHDEWIKWMVEKHIPEVMNTGFFSDSRIYKVLSEADSGITYSIQYDAANMEDYHAYVSEYAPQLQKEHTDKFKDKFVAFRTLLEKVK